MEMLGYQKFKIGANFSIDHMQQTIDLWTLLRDLQFDEHAEDGVVWKQTENGLYLVASAYLVQYMGNFYLPIEQTVWKACAPSKVKLFAWLAIQDRIWNADKLVKRG